MGAEDFFKANEKMKTENRLNLIDSGKVSKNQFEEIIALIQNTKNEVFRLANTALIDLYWKVGAYISKKVKSAEWGDGVVKQRADYIAKILIKTYGG